MIEQAFGASSRWSVGVEEELMLVDEQTFERRLDAARRAERHGLRVLAAGSHPFSRPEDQPVTDEPEYVEFVELAGPVARRQGVSGLHVHVGMPDAETCVRALE